MNASREAAKALFEAIAEFMPRFGYTGDGGSVPQMGAMSPVVHAATGAEGFMLHDTDSRETANYQVPMILDAPAVDALRTEGQGMMGLVCSAERRYYAEWN